MRDIRAYFLIAISIVAMAVAPPVTAEVTTFGSGSKLVRYSNEPLTPEAKKSYHWLRAEKLYFGAFYYNSAANAGFAVRAYHSLQSALSTAKSGCRAKSRNHPNGCKLYATVIPRSLSAKVSSASGLGKRAYQDFTGDYRKNQVNGKFGAFVITGMSDMGYSWNYPTKESAIEAAMNQCRADVAQTKADDFEPSEWKRVHRRGLDKCVVVHVHSP